MELVEAFLFDDDNEDKFAAHGLSIRQVGQILDEQFVVVPNRHSQRATLLVLGRDYGGTCIAVPIEPTHDPVLWRPITAWRCKAHEQAALDHKRRRP